MDQPKNRPERQISFDPRSIFDVVHEKLSKMVRSIKKFFLARKSFSPSEIKQKHSPPVSFQPVEQISIGHIIDTQHSSVRKQQRGVSSEQIDIIMVFGAHKKCGGQATKVYLDKKGRKELKHYLCTKRKSYQLLDKVKNIKLIISEPENQLITLYKG